ncbi:MAG TPA: hypothetical protein VLF39_00020 [Candidatus Saccharimonadales bacterium]|nr:hypothetical protein [Candidatus Saccharimonadales bacterium]
MKAEQRGDAPSPEEFDAEKFVRTYELIIDRGHLDKKERLEEIIYKGIFWRPDFAVELYSQLARSKVKEVREMAATYIVKAFKCDPEVGAVVWNSLLNDPDPEVAETAYLVFDDFCRDMDNDLERSWDLSGIASQ